MKAKRMLIGLLSAAMIAMVSDQSICRIPELIRSAPGEATSYSFSLPVKQEKAKAVMSDALQYAPEITEKILYPGGQSIGLSLTTEGVFIVEAADVILGDGSTANPAREAGLTSGDCVLRIDGKQISSMEMLTEAVQESGGKPMKVEYTRDGKVRTTEVTPVKDENGILRMGMWVRDSTAGIGTMTSET